MKRKIAFVLLLLVQVILLSAQLTPQQKQQLEEAQKKLKQMQSDPSIQKKMKQATQQLDKIKSDTAIAAKMKQANQTLKNHPEAGNVSLPDLNKIKVPNTDSFIVSTNNQMKGMQDKMAQLSQMKTAALPKANLSHHAESLANFKKAELLSLVQTTLNNLSPKLDMLLKTNLDKMVKDSTLNIAGTGLFYLSIDLSPREACGYLICKGIQLHPSDPYAINAFGVYCRNNNDLEKSLQLFLYADNLLPDSLKSPYIYANIGWASFYYGDFSAAQKYFDKALALSDSFQPALEGEAMIAYAKGDIQALFKCLSKELLASTKSKSGKGSLGGGSGPSESFVDVVTDEALQSVKNLDDQPDPTQDKSLDNVMEDDSSDDASDGGEDVTFEADSRPVFVCDPKSLPLKKGEAARFIIKAQNNMRSIALSINQQMNGLTPLAVSKKTDNDGSITISKSYRKFVDLIAEANRLFDRRVYWYRKKYIDEYKAFPTPWLLKMQDLITQFTKQLSNCPCECGDCAKCTECVNRVKCQWLPVLYTECNSDIESSTRIWNKYWDNIFNTIQWYLNVTNPFIKRVHDAGWNNYLNNSRISKIEIVVLTAYSDWAGEVINLPIDPYANEPIPSCPVQIAGIVPDPFSKKPKHIKEYEDPNCKDIDFPIGILGTITENCHYTKINIGPKIGPIQLGFSYGTNKDILTGEVKDPIYSQNNNFDHSYEGKIGVAYKLSYEEKEMVELGVAGGVVVTVDQQGNISSANTSIEGSGALDIGIAKMGMKASRTCQFDDGWNVTGYSNNVTGSGQFLNNASIDGSGHVGTGMTGNGEYSVTSNYDEFGNYIGGNTSATISMQQGVTSNTDKANQEFSNQNSFFGIQANQVIQVVAGKMQASPYTIK